jgi:hypothetical protein
MLRTASLSVIALMVSLVLTQADAGSPLAVLHLALAAGVMPLIFAAMIHFVPVLTRTGSPSRGIDALPELARLGGLAAVLAMQGWLPYSTLYVAAGSALGLAVILLAWLRLRAKATLGRPHPGWRWYAAALACLILALGAVFVGALWPEYWPNLRRLHLHLNTLGLVGLAALGTLPVLLPTALGQFDPEAATWLSRQWRFAVAGVLLCAAGSALYWPVSLPGAALLLLVTGSLWRAWIGRFGVRALLADGASASLVAALLGVMVLLLAGIAHAASVLPARPSLVAWVAGFLLPLVTGALTQLLPVWRWPGPGTPERSEMRQRLAAGGAVRALFFSLSGMLLLAGEALLGAVFGMAAMLLFIVGLSRGMCVRRATR